MDRMDVITVTGGSGFLGQHVVQTLQEKTDYVSEIRVLDVIPYVNLLGKKNNNQVYSKM
jgi:nucleoside-diphosphate-sugar epimerase